MSRCLRGWKSKLQAIPLICEKEGLLHPGRDDFRRTAIYVVPAALMVILGLTLAPDYQVVIQTALATLGIRHHRTSEEASEQSGKS